MIHRGSVNTACTIATTSSDVHDRVEHGHELLERRGIPAAESTGVTTHCQMTAGAGERDDGAVDRGVARLPTAEAPQPNAKHGYAGR